MASDTSKNSSVRARDDLIKKLSEAGSGQKDSDGDQSEFSEPRDHLQEIEGSELQAQTNSTQRLEEEKERPLTRKASGSGVGSQRGSSAPGSQQAGSQQGGSQRGGSQRGGSQHGGSQQGGSESHASGSSETGAVMTKEDLLAKVASLQAALTERDTQQQTLLQKLSTLQTNRESDEVRHRLQIKNAEQAVRDAVYSRDMLVDEMAGKKTRSDMKLENQIEKNAANLKISKEWEDTAVSRLAEVNSMQILLNEMRSKANDDNDHQDRVQVDHDLQIADLQSIISGLMKELSDQRNADSTTAAGENTEKSRIQEEMITMQLKSQLQTKEMRNMRLTMLGLKKDKAKQETAAAFGRPSVEPKPKQRHGRSRAAASALESIDEEEDLEDVQSVGISAAASDCTDSELGDESRPDHKGTQLLNKILGNAAGARENALLEELTSQRAASQLMKEDLMAEQSQQASRIARLLEQLGWARQEASDMQGTIDQMTADADEKATKHAFDLDAVQLELRESQLFSGDQGRELMRQFGLQAKHDERVEDLAGELHMARESLRISLMRLEDTQQALQRAEKSPPVQPQVPTKSDEDLDDEADLQTLLVQLRQEKNLLADQLEASDVSHRMVIEELKHEHDAEMMQVRKSTVSKNEAVCGSDTSQSDKPEDSTSAFGSLGSESTMSCKVILPSTEQSVERKPLAASSDINSCTGCFHAVSMALGLAEDTPMPVNSTHAMCWELVSAAPSSIAFFCLPEGLRAMKLSKLAEVRFGRRAYEQPLLTLFPFGQRQFVLRAIANQLASSSDQAAFSVRNIGTFDVEDNQPARFDITVACLPPGAGENAALIVMFSEQVKAPRRGKQSGSSASSDIAPSDSISQIGFGLGKSRGSKPRAGLRTSFT
eukprot:TRINITY_DN8341_c0_g1_i1.p1 TRINITY_DN8341_c0_g1~~TRINITY_DN8341_c0_g1_i1.p1  ORF type:complete len:899 (+),score=208.66 TRINITY_DN8341_c0_g1_i1:36-2699(+)